MAAMKPPYDKTEEWDMRTRAAPMAPLVNCPKHGITYLPECPYCKDQAELRKPLSNFAHAMEVKLRKNDHKTGWRELPVEALFRLLMIEIEEFKVANEFFGPQEARNELIDMANFCMMLHDRLGIEEDENSGDTK